MKSFLENVSNIYSFNHSKSFRAESAKSSRHATSLPLESVFSDRIQSKDPTLTKLFLVDSISSTGRKLNENWSEDDLNAQDD